MLLEVEGNKTVVASKLKSDNSLSLMSLGGPEVPECRDKIETEVPECRDKIEQFQVQPKIAVAEKRFEQ